MKCPNCKSSDNVRKDTDSYICNSCNIGFGGFENDICEALGHDLGGCSGGTCKRCGHFEPCG